VSFDKQRQQARTSAIVTPCRPAPAAGAARGRGRGGGRRTDERPLPGPPTHRPLTRSPAARGARPGDRPELPPSSLARSIGPRNGSRRCEIARSDGPRQHQQRFGRARSCGPWRAIATL